MNWPCRSAAAAWILLGLASASPAGQVKLEIRDGLVTLDARDATVREILVEWARVGQTTMVNADRVPGGPLTLQLSGVPERQALEVVLRSVAGFVAAPRAADLATASRFDRVVLMPVARPTTVPAASPAPAPNQAYQRIVQPQLLPATVADDQDEDAVPAVQMPQAGQPQGALQPGMATPYPSTVTQQNPQATPVGPVGGPYQMIQPPSAATPGTATAPQSAPLPGMPTALPAATRAPAPPGPIKTP